jgi:preprotein translocase SecE subunit
MAEGQSKRKPRIRKTAPTIRQLAEQASKDAEKEKPRRVRKAASKVASPLKKVRVPAHRFPKPLRVLGRWVKKVLSFLVPKYFINSWREVRLVTWPSRKETWRLTGAVFIFAAVFGVMVSVVDKILDLVFKHLILK